MFIIGILIICGIFYLFLKHNKEEESSLFGNAIPQQKEPQLPSTGGQKTNKTLVYLYFADKGNAYLMSEERAVFHANDSAELGRVIVEELIKGPDKGLMRTIPADTVLNALYVTKNGTAFIDMSEGIKENHPGGGQMELMTIYSIVNSMVLNIPEIKKVKILIQGREAMTLAGHVDLRFPFKANMILVR